MRCVWLFIDAIGARLFRAKKYPPAEARNRTSKTPANRSRRSSRSPSSIALMGSATAAYPSVWSDDNGTTVTRNPFTVAWLKPRARASANTAEGIAIVEPARFADAASGLPALSLSCT
jgi:hypothetical protein